MRAEQRTQQLAVQSRVAGASLGRVEHLDAPLGRVGLFRQLLHDRELGRVLRDRQRAVRPQPDIGNCSGELTPQLPGPERQRGLGAGRAPAHPHEPKVPHRCTARLGVPIEVGDGVTESARYPRVHRADDTGSHDHHPHNPNRPAPDAEPQLHP